MNIYSNRPRFEYETGFIGSVTESFNVRLGKISSKINQHVNDDDIHVTADDKAKWNSKVDQSVYDEFVKSIGDAVKQIDEKDVAKEIEDALKDKDYTSSSTMILAINSAINNSGYVTSAQVSQMISEINIPSLSGYLTKSTADNTYASKSEFNSLKNKVDTLPTSGGGDFNPDSLGLSKDGSTLRVKYAGVNRGDGVTINSGGSSSDGRDGKNGSGTETIYSLDINSGGSPASWYTTMGESYYIGTSRASNDGTGYVADSTGTFTTSLNTKYIDKPFYINKNNTSTWSRFPLSISKGLTRYKSVRTYDGNVYSQYGEPVVDAVYSEDGALTITYQTIGNSLRYRDYSNAYRTTGSSMPNTTYYSGVGLPTSGSKGQGDAIYTLDFVVKDRDNSGNVITDGSKKDVYLCIVDNDDSWDKIGTNNHWEKMDCFNSLYTDVIAATKAYFKNVVAGEVLVKNQVGQVVGGITSGNILKIDNNDGTYSNYTKPSDRSENYNYADIRIWAGASKETPDNIAKAQFTVNSRGDVVANNITANGNFTGVSSGIIRTNDLSVDSLDLTSGVKFVTVGLLNAEGYDLGGLDENTPIMVVWTKDTDDKITMKYVLLSDLVAKDNVLILQRVYFGPQVTLITDDRGNIAEGETNNIAIYRRQIKNGYEYYLSPYYTNNSVKLSGQFWFRRSEGYCLQQDVAYSSTYYLTKYRIYLRFVFTNGQYSIRESHLAVLTVFGPSYLATNWTICTTTNNNKAVNTDNIWVYNQSSLCYQQVTPGKIRLKSNAAESYTQQVSDMCVATTRYNKDDTSARFITSLSNRQLETMIKDYEPYKNVSLDIDYLTYEVDNSMLYTPTRPSNPYALTDSDMQTLLQYVLADKLYDITTITT